MWESAGWSGLLQNETPHQNLTFSHVTFWYCLMQHCDIVTCNIVTLSHVTLWHRQGSWLFLTSSKLSCDPSSPPPSSWTQGSCSSLSLLAFPQEVGRDGGVHLEHHHHLYRHRIHAFPDEVDSDVGVHTNHHNSPPHCHCIRAFLAFFSCFTHPSNPIFMNILVTVLLFYATFWINLY